MYAVILFWCFIYVDYTVFKVQVPSPPQESNNRLGRPYSLPLVTIS